jgi:polyisoprenyl-teichoic acid--peptidoglycan teichoic acid transferase
VRFEPGPQHLDGVRVAELLGFRMEGEGELLRLARIRRVFDGLFAALAADPAHLEAVFADGAPMLDTHVPSEELERLFGAVAWAQQAGRLDALTLPVVPLEGVADGALRVDQERAAGIVAERFSRAVPSDVAAGQRRLQILNGNGRPGIGQEVAARVLPAGFRVVLTDNADSFDHEQTRILVHDDDTSQVELARELARLIGVGRVEISRTPQSVVDFTVVVGHDFLELVDDGS